MKIVRETNRKILVIHDYLGTCDACQSPLEYNEDLALIEISRTGNSGVYVPIDVISCPNCFHTIGTLNLHELKKSIASPEHPEYYPPS